jgi:arylsulfatase A-like enzyme
MFKFIDYIGRFLLVVVVAGLIALLGFWLKITFSSQIDDTEHLQAKQDYLTQLSSSGQDISGAPNVVIILFDDMGYGDLGVTGSQVIKTPAIDQLANQGVLLTNYYAPAPTCSPSRAGLLTGRYPLRAGLPEVLFPSSDSRKIILSSRGVNMRLPAEEITIADTLKAAGYRTGLIGKWHLGDTAPSLPQNFGFDSTFGPYYSNDQKPFQIYRDDSLFIEAPIDQAILNDLYSDEAVRFISEPDDTPFFLYFAHSFPHDPLPDMPENHGRSGAGVYGDIVEALDDTVATVVETLRKSGKLDNTLILISSDNGPWFEGSPGGFRGRKGETFDGGMHVPLVAHWPQELKGGRVIEGISMGIDWLPTLLDWIGLPLPSDRIIDGKSLRPMLTEGASSPHQQLYFFGSEELIAVRDQTYKYRRPHAYIYAVDPMPFAVGRKQPGWLFNLDADASESYDVSAHAPERAASLRAAMQVKQQEMQDNLRGWQ